MVRVLESHAAAAADTPGTQKGLELHIVETRLQAERLRDCIVQGAAPFQPQQSREDLARGCRGYVAVSEPCWKIKKSRRKGGSCIQLPRVVCKIYLGVEPLVLPVPVPDCDRESEPDPELGPGKAEKCPPNL